MLNLKIPLSDIEEALLESLQKINRLEAENKELKETIKRLEWSLQEHD
jgi:hypothetical protein